METRKERNRKKKIKQKKITRVTSLVFILVTLFTVYYLKENIFKEEETIVKTNVDKKSNIAKKEISNQQEEEKNQDDKEKDSSKDNTEEFTEQLQDSNRVTYSYGKYTIYGNNASNESINFWFGKNESNEIPSSPLSAKVTEKYNCHYVGNKENVIYLTFDEGIDTTYANKNLDTLKKYNIKATFFLTGSFIESHPDIVKRMSDEGHICANHTYSHSDMALFAKENPQTFIKEVVEAEEAFKKVTNKEMDKYIRLPEGTYSEKVLDSLNQMGYTTIFWSFAIKDWSEEWNNKDEVLQNMKKYYHQGAIYLLHGLNKANSEALDEFISYMQGKDYSFKPVSDIK